MNDGGHTGGDQRGEADKDRLIEELREAVQARDEFVSIAAHELRNPMTPILMQVHNLVTAARDPSRCRPEVLAPRLELLEHAVRDFVRRSTALLDVSRMSGSSRPSSIFPASSGRWWTARRQPPAWPAAG